MGAIDSKARKYVDEGRVSVLSTTKLAIRFVVEGSDTYRTTFLRTGGFWECTCPARVVDCAHVRAAQLWIDDKAAQGTDTLIESLTRPSKPS